MGRGFRAEAQQAEKSASVLFALVICLLICAVILLTAAGRLRKSPRQTRSEVECLLDLDSADVDDYGSSDVHGELPVFSCCQSAGPPGPYSPHRQS